MIKTCLVCLNATFQQIREGMIILGLFIAEADNLEGLRPYSVGFLSF